LRATDSTGVLLDLFGDLLVFLLPNPLIGEFLFGEVGVPKLLFLERELKGDEVTVFYL
jgi:hypothetical protein